MSVHAGGINKDGQQPHVHSGQVLSLNELLKKLLDSEIEAKGLLTHIIFITFLHIAVRVVFWKCELCYLLSWDVSGFLF